MTDSAIEIVITTSLIVAIPLLIIISYMVYIINKEVYQELNKNNKKQ
ncbi:hypothetical protein [Flavobacterium sp. LAR06]